MRRNFRRNIAILVTLSLILTTSTISFGAVSQTSSNSPLDYTSLLTDVSEMSTSLKNIGINSDLLAETLSKSPKNSEFYGESKSESMQRITQIAESNIGLDSHLSGAIDNAIISTRAYDCLTPQNDQEQIARMNYILNLVDEDYQDKVAIDQTGRYVVYLYMSHYIDNRNYDRNSPNFNHILAHIISESDISAYDSFLELSMYTDFSSNLASLGNSLYSVKDNMSYIANKVTLMKDYSAQQITQILLAGDDLNLSANEVLNATGAIASSMLSNYDSIDDAEALINTVIAELTPTIGDGVGLTDLVGGFILDLILMQSPVAGLIIGSFVLANECFNAFLNLAGMSALAYSFSARVADRTGIEVGLHPRP